MVNKNVKPGKQSLSELLRNSSVITGEEMIRQLKERERLQKEFEESIEFEERNRKPSHQK